MGAIRRLVQSAVLSGAMAVSAPALASGVSVFPSKAVGGEVGYKLEGEKRIMGYADITGELGLLSCSDLGLNIGAKFMTYFRNIEKVTEVQPDVINYDVWGGVGYSSGIGEFGLSYYHQCMHNVDEQDMKLVEDSRSHDILRLSYSGKFGVLEGLELSFAMGPYVKVIGSRYNFMFESEVQLNLVSFWDVGEFYVRSLDNPVIAEQEDGWWQYNHEKELGLEFKGGSFSMQVFLKYERLEDYFIFDSRAMDLFFLGVRFR